jgi:hypothetical protein
VWDFQDSTAQGADRSLKTRPIFEDSRLAAMARSGITLALEERE